MKHKIVLEIDGVRHKLIRTRSTRPCKNCSLNSFIKGNEVSDNVEVSICGNIIDAPCTGFRDHFRKCKPGE